MYVDVDVVPEEKRNGMKREKNRINKCEQAIKPHDFHLILCILCIYILCIEIKREICGKI